MGEMDKFSVEPRTNKVVGSDPTQLHGRILIDPVTGQQALVDETAEPEISGVSRLQQVNEQFAPDAPGTVGDAEAVSRLQQINEQLAPDATVDTSAGDPVSRLQQINDVLSPDAVPTDRLEGDFSPTGDTIDYTPTDQADITGAPGNFP